MMEQSLITHYWHGDTLHRQKHTQFPARDLCKAKNTPISWQGDTLHSQKHKYYLNVSVGLKPRPPLSEGWVAYNQINSWIVVVNRLYFFVGPP